MASNSVGYKVRDAAMETYQQDFVQDIKDAGYYKDIEDGIYYCCPISLHTSFE